MNNSGVIKAEDRQKRYILIGFNREGVDLNQKLPTQKTISI
jgi:hypothetical protein